MGENLGQELLKKWLSMPPADAPTGKTPASLSRSVASMEREYCHVEVRGITFTPADFKQLETLINEALEAVK